MAGVRRQFHWVVPAAWAVAVTCALLGYAGQAAAQDNSISLTKTPAPATYSVVGQVITYTYVVTRNGTSNDVFLNSINDNKVVGINCPVTDIPPNGSVTCTGTYTITNADVAAGSVTNTAVTTAEDSSCECTITSNVATATITLAAPTGAITIVKTSTGGNETFSFTSSITGATNFTLLTVGGSATRGFANLQPGTYTFTEVNLPLNWRLDSLSCVGDAGGTPTTVNLSSRTASVGLNAGESITCTFANVFDLERHRSLTQSAIMRFLAHRLQLLLNDESDRNRLIRRLQGILWGQNSNGSAGATPLSFTGTTGPSASQMSFSTSLHRIMQAHEDAAARAETQALSAYAATLPVKARPRLVPQNGIDVWMEVHYSQFSANDLAIQNRGHFGVAYLGADYLVSSSLLLGALVQYDWMNERAAATPSSAGGHGLMFGPYMSMRLAENIFFDARVAWGSSDNNVDPFGVYRDRFTTRRWLARANLTGNWQFGAVRVAPTAGVTYAEEQQRDYIDSLGVLIPAQTVALGRFDFGPEVAYRITLASGVVVEPQVAVKGIWDFKRPDTNSLGTLVVTGDAFHVKAQGGVLVRGAGGVSMRAVASYDGIGSSRFRQAGGQVWVSVPLH